MNKEDYMYIGIYLLDFAYENIIFKVPDNLTKEEIIKELNRVSKSYFIIFNIEEIECNIINLIFNRNKDRIK